MDAPRREMRDVVLVEAAADPVAGRPTASLRDAGSRAEGIPLRRSRRAWPVAALAALAALVGAGTISAARENARIAALADIPGVLAPLDGPVRELWATSGLMITGYSAYAGRLLAVESYLDGQVAVVALDPATGEAAWQVAARDPGRATGRSGTSCALPDAPGSSGGAGATPDPAVVACVVVDESTTIAKAAIGEGTYPTKTHLLVIDAGSGAVVSNRPTDPSTTVSLLGGDLLLSTVDADGRLRVVRADPVGAAIRWTFTSPDPLGADDLGQRSPSVEVVGGLVVINALTQVESAADGGTGGWSWVLSADGDVVRTRRVDPSAGYSGGIDVLPDGTFVESTATVAGELTTTVTDAATGRAFTSDAYPARADPDDGSLGSLVLMSSPADTLIAYDRASGRPRWTAPAGGGGPASALVIDGRIIRTGVDRLTSIDGRTGQPLWTTPVELAEMSALATDGRVVLLTRPRPDGGSTLSAYGLDDGRLRWETELRRDNLWLIGVGGRLYGLLDQGLAALG